MENHSEVNEGERNLSSPANRRTPDYMRREAQGPGQTSEGTERGTRKSGNIIEKFKAYRLKQIIKGNCEFDTYWAGAAVFHAGEYYPILSLLQRDGLFTNVSKMGSLQSRYIQPVKLNGLDPANPTHREQVKIRYKKLNEYMDIVNENRNKIEEVIDERRSVFITRYGRYIQNGQLDSSAAENFEHSLKQRKDEINRKLSKLIVKIDEARTMLKDFYAQEGGDLAWEIQHEPELAPTYVAHSTAGQVLPAYPHRHTTAADEAGSSS